MEAILKEALKIDVQVPDSGASNLDECIITIPDEVAKKINGVQLFRRRKDTYIILGNVQYQGKARTKLAEAVCDCLKSQGVSAYVEYNLD